MPNIKLRSSDEEIIEVDIKVAKMSRTIRTMMENLGIGLWHEDDDLEQVLPLLEVVSAILKKVLEWAAHHKDDAHNLDNLSPEGEDEVLFMEPEFRGSLFTTEWDKRWFLQVDHPTLLDIMQAANYLDIIVLLDVASGQLSDRLFTNTFADLMKGKTPEEIQDTSSIKKDATPKKDEEQAQKECEEKMLELTLTSKTNGASAPPAGAATSSSSSSSMAPEEISVHEEDE